MAPALFRRRDPAGNIQAVYGAIVAQARQSAFYADYGVPDTLEGRFDMIVLHLCLLVRRLRTEPDLREVGQGVFDAFCLDMDHNLRELGISDTGVPRRMKKFGEAFYGRAASYDRAFAGEGETLAEALRRNVYASREATAGAERLARYVYAAEAALAAQPASALTAGEVRFPPPESVTAA